MRIAEPMPFGLTSLLLITRAMVSAFFVKMFLGGYVATVLTVCTHFFVLGTSLPLPDFSSPVVLHVRLVLVHAHNLV